MTECGCIPKRLTRYSGRDYGSIFLCMWGQRLSLYTIYKYMFSDQDYLFHLVYWAINKSKYIVWKL